MSNKRTSATHTFKTQGSGLFLIHFIFFNFFYFLLHVRKSQKGTDFIPKFREIKVGLLKKIFITNAYVKLSLVTFMDSMKFGFGQTDRWANKHMDTLQMFES